MPAKGHVLTLSVLAGVHLRCCCTDSGMATLDDALRQPDLPPGPHYLQNSQVRQYEATNGPTDLTRAAWHTRYCYLQITCGVLHKYVNFGKGWRHRVFVLKDGVFLYYKVHCTGLVHSTGAAIVARHMCLSFAMPS